MKPKWDIAAGVEMLKAGVSVRDVAVKLGVDYANVYQVAMKRGLGQSVNHWDKRTLRERIEEVLIKTENGCIYLGAWRYMSGVARTPFRLGNHYFGTDFKYNHSLRMCSTKYCLNQAHYMMGTDERNREIIAAWDRYVESRVTLEATAKKYGITCQRVGQILRRTRKVKT